MQTNPIDLWPADFGKAEATPPVFVLREQATALGNRTRNVLTGEVKTHSNASGFFTHNFYVVAPALDGYRYLLFSCIHQVTSYPVQIYIGSNRDVEYMLGKKEPIVCPTEGEFIEQLKNVLSSEETRRIIQSLMAQSTA